jgi:serpin B
MARVGLTLALILALALTTAVAAPSRGQPAAAKPPSAANAAQASNALGLDLFRHAGDGNVALSPYSVWSALTMAYAGADGETRRQMARVLRAGRFGNRTGRAYDALRTALHASTKASGAQLDIANALWGATDADLRRRFLRILRRDYAAPLERVDFRGDPDAARALINQWVEEHTQEKITNLFGPSHITRDTRLALANALYLKAGWLDEFDPDNTRDERFHAPGGDVTVPTMNRLGEYRHARVGELEAVALPYRGERMSMLLVLPGGRAIGTRALRRIDAALEPATFELALPRFRVATRLDLGATLARLGMPRAFSDEAQFPRMSATEALRIQAVVHKVWIEVGEEGTEAAAATGVSFDTVSAPPRVAFDRPFHFFVRDDRSGAILFMGRVENPAR